MFDEVRQQIETIKGSHRLNQSTFELVAQVCGESVDKVMMSAMDRESMDNLSVVIMSFPNFSRHLESMEPQQGIVSQQRNRS